MTSERSLKKVDVSQYNSLELLLRFLRIEAYYGSMDGLLRAQYAYPNVHFRHVIAPSSSLDDSFYPLDLSLQDVENIWT